MQYMYITCNAPIYKKFATTYVLPFREKRERKALQSIDHKKSIY